MEGTLHNCFLSNLSVLLADLSGHWDLFQATFVKQHFLGRVQELPGVADICGRLVTPGSYLSFPSCLCSIPFLPEAGCCAHLTSTESPLWLGAPFVHCILFFYHLSLDTSPELSL